MPNDVTASVIPIIRMAMDRVFQNKGNVEPWLNKTPVTAPLLASKQTAKVEELKAGAGNQCVGTRIWYSLADNATESVISGTPVASVCELTTGDGVSSASVDYDFNLFDKRTIKLNDNDCDNFYKFPERIADLLIKTQTAMVQGLNTHVINQLEANKTVATATELPAAVTLSLGDYTITGADYWVGDKVQETLAAFDILADKHGLGNYMVISGRSLQVAQKLAMFNRENVGCCDFGNSVAFGRQELFFDSRNLDAVIGAEVVYLVDPRAYATYFYAEYPEQGVELKDEFNTMQFSLPLQYFNNFAQDNTNVSTLQYWNGDMMANARIDVRYQRKCNVSGKYGKTSLDHIWELDLVGMFALAPNDGSETGIVKIVKA